MLTIWSRRLTPATFVFEISWIDPMDLTTRSLPLASSRAASSTCCDEARRLLARAAGQTDPLRLLGHRLFHLVRELAHRLGGLDDLGAAGRLLARGPGDLLGHLADVL